MKTVFILLVNNVLISFIFLFNQNASVFIFTLNNKKQTWKSGYCYECKCSLRTGIAFHCSMLHVAIFLLKVQS